MPRGRGRGNDQSRNKPPSGSERSASRRGRSTTASTLGSLRRSTRIASQSRTRLTESQDEPLSQTQPPMADVARRTGSIGLSSRAIQHDFTRGRARQQPRTSRPEDTTSSYTGRQQQQIDTNTAHSRPFRAGESAAVNGDSGFTMDVIVQPPSTANPDALLPAIAVRLRQVRHDRETSTLDHDSAELSHLVAAVNLISDSPSPVDPNALSGGRVDSIRPFTGSDHINGLNIAGAAAGLGYFSFPDLAIRQEGTFRIRVTLIRVGHAAGVAVAQVDTTPIRIGADTDKLSRSTVSY